MTLRIGNTTYIVIVFQRETAADTFEDKLLRLVRTDSALHKETHDETQEE